MPVFETDEAGLEVRARLGGADAPPVRLGQIKLDDRQKVMKEKNAGTQAKPLAATVCLDGQGTLTIVLPGNGLPGVKLCVQVGSRRWLCVILCRCPLSSSTNRHFGCQAKWQQLCFEMMSE